MMKRNLSLWLGLPAAAGLVAFALLPALAQMPPLTAPTGKVHGQVTNPSGAPQAGGTVSFGSVDRAGSGPGIAATTSEKASFPVDANGDYSGQLPPGTYTAIYRSPGMGSDKQADHADNVRIVVGQDTLQDIDMSRKEYIDALPADQQKQLEDLRKHNSEAMKANEIIKGLNSDLKVVAQDIKDADGARAAAVQALGATASKSDLDAKEAEIKTAKYTEIETLMTKDTAAKADASILWARLALAQAGLKKYDAAEASYKKALEVESTSKKPILDVQGLADSGLGEIYARTGKVPEANAAYDAAAKVNPTQAGLYLKNEAVIFFQMNNGDAQVAAADEAIAVDPNEPILYYLKGQGLIQKATLDPKTQKIVAPPGCLEAYQKYLQLAPDGPYAGEVKGILAGFDQKIDNSYKAPAKKKSS
jgi:tetratricopeptide (TPR) repeat protein